MADPGGFSLGGTIDGNVLGTAPARDGTGSIYVAGTFLGSMTLGGTTLNSGNGAKMYVARISYLGVAEWVQTVPTLGNSGFGYCCNLNNTANLRLDTDESGNAYVANSFYGTLNFPGAALSNGDGYYSFVAKINPAGQWQWARGIKTGAMGAQNLSVEALSVADDSQGATGKVYVDVGGVFKGGATFGSLAVLTAGSPFGSGDGWVARLDAAGNWVWRQKMDSLYNGTNDGDSIARITSITNDTSGNVYAVGMFDRGANFPGRGTLGSLSAQGGYIFIGKIGSNGQWNWVTRGGAQGSFPGITITGISRDKTNGNLFVGGHWTSTGNAIIDGTNSYGTFPNRAGVSFLAKLTSLGTWDWVNISPDAGFYPGCGCQISRMQTDSAGGIYLTGKFRSLTINPETPNAFAGDPNDPNNPVRIVAPTPGNFPPGGNEAEIWVAKAQDGVGGPTWQWAKSGGQNDNLSGYDNAFDLILDDFGQVTIGGDLPRRSAFATDHTTPGYFGSMVLQPVGTNSYGYVAKLTPSGNWLQGTYAVGQPIYPPAGAINSAPDIELLSGPPGVNVANAFLWCAVCPNPGAPSSPGAAFITVPGTGFLRWKVSTNQLDPNRIAQLVIGALPENPQIHIAGVPVDLEAGQTNYTYGTMGYSTSLGASDENKVFTANNPGFSVLLYSRGPVLNPNQFPVAFTVVNTVDWNSPDCTTNPDCLTQQPWTIGQKITEASHVDPSGKNGYVLLERGRYDGFGPNRAYDRDTRIGPILPVNQDTASAEDDLVVVWSKTNATTGVPWPVKPIRYNLSWPTTTDQLIIADGHGSETGTQPKLDPAVFPSKLIYSQSDPTKPGYNPNDEHALFAPSNRNSGFETLFALRSDLTTASQPYTLLKYRDTKNTPTTADDEWALKVYKVIPGTFAYSGIAGQVIQPPYPLGLLGPCSTAPRATYHVGRPGFRDCKGTFWGRSAGAVDLHYFYPLQSSFAYDIDGDAVPDQPSGTCVPWLDRLGTIDTPIRAVYTLVWPDNPPVLAIGETLLTPKNGLPDIKNQASAKIIFDQSDPNESDTDTALAQLIDPLAEHTVDLNALPTDLATGVDGPRTTIVGNIDGLRRLAFDLRVRLTFHRDQKQLGFRGWFDDTGDYISGEPLLLPNVLSAVERDLLKGLSDEAAWDQAIDDLYWRTRNPRELDLDNNGQADQRFLIGLQDADDDGVAEPLELFGQQGALTAGRKQRTGADATGHITVVFNDDQRLNPSPVSVSVIRVDCLQDSENNLSPYQGQIQTIRSDNVFDELLTLRHSGDFGGDPDQIDFRWYFQTADGPQPAPPEPNAPLGLWLEAVPAGGGPGRNSITIGTTPNVRTLSDNWYIARYTGYAACGNETRPSAWAGDPAGTLDDPAPKSVEGWIKRVVTGLNPFDQAISDFHRAAPNTFASMLVQLGGRYEGDIALSPNPASLLGIRLIAAYETALRRALGLSVDAGFEFQPANDALLNISSRLADAYMLLGNEAYADAQDPTIGYSTIGGVLGNLAPAVFAFENQLSSLLEEELGLLRGRDARGASPAYNRLLWNFTNGNGQIAYVQSYNVSDQNVDGRVDVTDGAFLYPQGHGDAWGHYLTAIDYYYRLLRHPNFRWLPRTEFVNVAGTAIEVDYLDERKFAAVAVAKARAGAEIMDLTYRLNYVEDPAGQWQGYQDVDPQRAWGVTEWARRAGQGTYLDWVVANSILPAVDPNPTHEGIQKVDRTTVHDIAEISSQLLQIHQVMDKADQGLNPVGLAKGAIAFDIDPSLLSGSLGRPPQSHFEQVYARALTALRSAVKTFDNANQLSQMLRRNQDTIDDFRRNVQDQERDYKNRLIEIFGTPYADDIGPQGTYPIGYDGADFYHFQYVDQTELTGESASVQVFTAYFAPVGGVPGNFFPSISAPSARPESNVSSDTDARGAEDFPEVLPVQYTVSTDGFGIVKPPNWTSARKAPGELQRLLSEFYRARANYTRTVREYTNHLDRVDDQLALMQLRYDTNDDLIDVVRNQQGTIKKLNSEIAEHRRAAGTMAGLAKITLGVADAAVEAFPRVAGLAYDVTSPYRYALKAAAIAATIGLEAGAASESGAANRGQDSKLEIQLSTDIQLRLLTTRFEEQQALAELQELIRQEPALRLGVYIQEDVLRQSAANFAAKLAQGERMIQELTVFRQRTAADVADYRYQDMAFRIFRNDALQKYRAAFDLAARYAYLAATAYDYETMLLGSSTQAGRRFLTDIVRFRSLGQLLNELPVAGSRGLADPLARLSANFDVLKGQLGFNNPQIENTGFSLRSEAFRIRSTDPTAWRSKLESYRVPDLTALPEFKKYCRPFAPTSAGPQPGLVIEFETTVTHGKNFFGLPLGGGDAAFDATHFATKVRSVGLSFVGYDDTLLSRTPRAYLVPVGLDVLRSPTGDTLATREFKVADQALPPPFPVGDTDLADPDWIPMHDSLPEELGAARRHATFKAFPQDEDDLDFDPLAITTENRLVGRSVWNTRWMLLIPGSTLLGDADEGLDTFIHGAALPGGDGSRDGNGVQDVRLFFTTYAYTGQ